jgi:hypothetical protein
VCNIYVANGHTFLVYKDNGTRKVVNADMEHLVSFSNTILASRQVGHVGAKQAAVVERLCPAFHPDARDSDISDEEDSDNEGEHEEDSGNEKDEGSAEDSNKSVLPVQAAKTTEVPNVHVGVALAAAESAATEPPTNSETAAHHLPQTASNTEKDPPPAFEEGSTDRTENIHGTAADARQDGEPSTFLSLRNGGSEATASTLTSDNTLTSSVQQPTFPPGY